MKTTLASALLIMMLAASSSALAKCFELRPVHPQQGDADQLCLRSDGQGRLLREGSAVHSFLARVVVLPPHRVCGGRDRDRCSWVTGARVLEHRDERSSFRVAIPSIPGTSSGAQTLQFDGRRYRFWFVL